MREQKVFRQCVCGVAVLLPLCVAPSLARASVFADLDVQASRDDNVGRAAKSGDVRNDASVQVAGRVGGAWRLRFLVVQPGRVVRRGSDYAVPSVLPAVLGARGAGLAAPLALGLGQSPPGPASDDARDAREP